MKKLTRTTAALGAAGLVAAALAAAPPANAVSSIFQIKVTEVTTSQHDTIGNVPQVGDTFSFTSNLRQDGNRVGKDAGVCTFKRIFGDRNNPTSADMRCVVRFQFFNTGTMRAAGTFRVTMRDLQNNNLDVKIPIRNGSGKFANAGGTVRNEQVNATKSRLTFRLTGVN